MLNSLLNCAIFNSLFCGTIWNSLEVDVNNMCYLCQYKSVPFILIVYLSMPVLVLLEL